MTGPGNPAPAFDAVDAFGRPVRPADFRGQGVLLSFYRYASCPLCNLRVRALAKLAPGWRDRGLDLVGVFPSPVESLREYLAPGELPFPVVPDPGEVLYKRYGVTASWRGTVRGALRPELWTAWARGGFRLGKREGAVSRLPADFLVGPDGAVAVAYRGRDIGDHLPVAEVEAWLTR